MKHLMLVLLVGTCSTLCSSQTGDDQQLNARDAFWSAADLVDAKRNPPKADAAAASNNAPSKAHPKTRRPESSKSSPNTVWDEKYPTESKECSANNCSPQNASAKQSPSVADNDEKRVHGPTPNKIAEQHLGLRYTVLKKQDEGDYQEVSPSSEFHAGDKIRISVMTNEPGYVYIVGKGTSGEWKPLFPPRDDSAPIAAGKPVEFPTDASKTFAFDETPGTEQVFLMVSTSREDVRQVIASLKQVDLGDSGDRPVMAKNDSPLLTMLGDASVRSRDLVVTEVGNESSEKKAPEKAVYVVNRSTQDQRSGHAVVAELQLKHR